MRVWKSEIRLCVAPKLERGYRQALEDIQPDRSFVVYGGEDRYPKGHGTEVIGLKKMAQLLAAL